MGIGHELTLPRLGRWLLWGLGGFSALLLGLTIAARQESSSGLYWSIRWIGTYHVFVIRQTRFERWQIYYGLAPTSARYASSSGWSLALWQDGPFGWPSYEEKSKQERWESRLMGLLSTEAAAPWSTTFTYARTADFFAVLPVAILISNRRSLIERATVLGRRIPRTVSTAILAMFMFWFACTLWPTRYSYGNGEGLGHIGVPYRVDRFTGQKEWYHLWKNDWEVDRQHY